MKIGVSLSAAVISAVLLQGAAGAADVAIRGSGEALQPCSALTWASHERIPVFDALTSPDTEEGRRKLEAVNQVARNALAEAMAKRGRPISDHPAPCEVSYTVFQELDLDISRHGGATLAPRSTDPVGPSGIDSAQHSRLKQAATFTLIIRPSGTQQVLWQGELRESVGTASQVPKRLERVIRKVVDALPKPR